MLLGVQFNVFAAATFRVLVFTTKSLYIAFTDDSGQRWSGSEKSLKHRTKKMPQFSFVLLGFVVAALIANVVILVVVVVVVFLVVFSTVGGITLMMMMINE